MKIGEIKIKKALYKKDHRPRYQETYENKMKILTEYMYETFDSLYDKIDQFQYKLHNGKLKTKNEC